MKTNIHTQNAENVTYKFITDYKNADGKDYHQCFEISGVPDNTVSENERKKNVAEYLKHKLYFQGYTPTRIILADCDLPLDKLQDLTDGKFPLGYVRVINLEEYYNADI